MLTKKKKQSFVFGLKNDVSPWQLKLLPLPSPMN